MKRWLLVVVLGLLWIAQGAQAQSSVPAIHYYGAQWNSSFPLTYGTDPVVQCGNLLSQRNQALPGQTLAPPATFGEPLNCFAQGQMFGGLGDWWSCPSGYGNFDNTTKTCTPTNACAAKAGQTVNKNLTLGYNDGLGDTGVIQYKPDGTKAPQGYYGRMPSDPAACIDSCMMTMSGINNVWVSETPTEKGLYRISGDYSMTYTGQVCAASSSQKAEGSPTEAAPSPDCTPGVQNGKEVCVPKSFAERNSVPAQGGKNATRGNPKAGEENATADKIPPTGNGSNSGGPKQASDGGTRMPSGATTDPKPNTGGSTTPPPDGTIDAPLDGKEQANCGAPGQPACRIDEGGMPTGTGASDKGPLEASMTQLDQGLQGILIKTDKDTSWSMPSWFPSSGCSPFDLGSFDLGAMGTHAIVLDLCPYMPYINGVVNFFWILSTFIACLAMVERVMMGPSKA